MRFRLTLILSLLLALAPAAIAQSIDQRLSALEQWAGKVDPTFAASTQPAAQPADVPPANAQATVDVESQDQLVDALAKGATSIQTKGLTLTKFVDLRGATLAMLPGTENWRPVVTLADGGGIANGHIDSDKRKAIVATGKATRVEHMTFGAGVNYCLHVQAGVCSVSDFVTSDTFYGYGVYLEPGAAITLDGGFIGSSNNESSFRSDGGRATLSNLKIDATLAKASGVKVTALRGDFPARTDGSPGLVAVNCTFAGLVGPNPLDGNDGGQLWGVDRWRLASGATVQASLDRQAELIKLAQDLAAAGKSIADIAQATAAKVGTTLTAADAQATAAARRAALGKTSVATFQDDTFTGSIRFAARETVRMTRCSLDAGDAPLIAGNSVPTYPDPPLVLAKDEAGSPPAWTFESCELKGNGVGVDLANYLGVSVDGKAMTAASVKH